MAEPARPEPKAGPAGYETRRLLCGRVLFDRVRMLQPGKLDGEAGLEMPDHAAGDLAERDVAADLGPLFGADAGAGQGNVDDPHADVGGVRHDQAGAGDLRHETAVAAVFRQVEDAAV